jgi:hypothetical protein
MPFFDMTAYDGHLAEHPNPESKGLLLLGPQGRPSEWSIQFGGSRKIFEDGLKYPMVATAVGVESRRIVMTDREDPSFRCAFELVRVSEEYCTTSYADWQKRCGGTGAALQSTDSAPTLSEFPPPTTPDSLERSVGPASNSFTEVANSADEANALTQGCATEQRRRPKRRTLLSCAHTAEDP